MTGIGRMQGAMALAVAALAAAGGPARATDFNCRNLEAEISCANGACTVTVPGGSDGFTPMGLTRRGATLSICAYSGCWEGRISLRRTRGVIEMLFATVTNPQGHGGPTELAVIYNRETNSAQANFLGFANAMGCAGAD